MENNIKVRHNPHQAHRAHLKKITRYKDSLSKYKNTIPKLIQKYNIIPTQEQSESKINLKNLREGLMEDTAEIGKNEVPSIFSSTTSYERRTNPRHSLSAPRYHILKATSPKRNYLRREKNINHHTPISLYRSCVKNDDFNGKRNRNNKISDILSSSFRTRTNSRSRGRAIFQNNYNEMTLNPKRSSIPIDGINNLLTKSYAGKSIKGLEKSTQNNILQKQNQELRQKVREMRFKINDLLNEIKSLRIDNQRAENDKQKLYIKILDLTTLLDKKENLIIRLSNNMKNYSEEIEYDDNNINEGYYNKGKNIYNKTQKYNDGNNFGDDNDLRRLNKDEIINEINNLREKIENLNNQKKSIERKNKMMNFNLFENNEKIAKLIKENKNFRIMNQKLKNESQKIKNYYMTLLNDQKILFEIQQKEYQNNLNDLGLKLDVLKEENDALKNEIDNVSINNLPTNQNKRDNENMNNQFLEQLIKENNMLKAQLKEKDQELNNNNFNEGNNYENNFKEINYLKNDLEEKNNRIISIQEKVKNLFTQMNSFKNNNEVFMKNNTQLEQKINQLNFKVNNLENENLKKQKKILDLNNLNNKLSMQINNANNDNCQQAFNNNDINYNEEIEEQITLLGRENEELQEQLMNNEKNNNIKINQILLEKNNLIKENSNLKEEIITLQNKINESKNENNNNVLNLQRIDKLEKDLEEAKNECELNLKKLKFMKNENQKLLNIIKNNERENLKFKNEFESTSDDRKSGNLDIRDDINIHLSQEIEEKNTKIENLEKEINSYKSKNDKLYLECSSLKEQLDNIQNEQNNRLLIDIDNLKEELKDKTSQIKKLVKENDDLRKSDYNNIIEEKEIDLNNNKNEKNLFRNSLISTGLNDGDLIKLLKDDIKNYKLENNSDKIQIKTLKEEIKKMNAKIKDLETFGGQMKNMTEFFSLLNQVLLNYKPKSKEQKEALNKIMVVLNNREKKK